MQVAHPQLHHETFFDYTKRNAAAKHKKGSECNASQHARDEIDAFIATRDVLLANAEKSPTKKAIERAAAANDMVEACLQRVRPPYQAQCLAESDAISERKTCRQVRQRIAELREALAI